MKGVPMLVDVEVIIAALVRLFAGYVNSELDELEPVLERTTAGDELLVIMIDTLPDPGYVDV